MAAPLDIVDAVATMTMAASKISALRELLRRADEFLALGDEFPYTTIELRRLQKLRAEIAEEL